MQPCPQAPSGDHPFIFDDPHWLEDGSCSYCGSCSPELFFKAIEDGFELDPTDKDYKVYVRIPGKFTKFYFYHLNREEMQRFVNLLNDNKINIGVPGRFYVKPYFIV